MSSQTFAGPFCCGGPPLTLINCFPFLPVCVGHHQFHDQYFDTPTFDLTLRNMWLRKRKGCWELKCPTTQSVNSTQNSSGQQSKAGLCTQYNELTNLHEIHQRVIEVINAVCEERGTKPIQLDLEESWVQNANLVCFAEFTTIRQSFALKGEGVNVDLDQADFGYQVGEVEVVIPKGGDVQAALEKIENIAKKLGLNPHERVLGKMDVYLKKNNPEHLATLKRMHVL
uniref:Thiamine triphosphatase n=1 Tax=Cynoglossus semilaevis TaxID=244447 RepID=A0A3P8VLC2_CYNSE